MHFQVYGAFFSGQYEPAIRAAKQMQATVLPEYLLADHAFLVNYLEAFYGMKAHVLVRFGKWQEILDEPLPEDQEMFCVTFAIWQYAKGIAHAVLGNIDAALEQQRLLRVAVGALPADRIVFQNDKSSTASCCLKIEHFTVLFGIQSTPSWQCSDLVYFITIYVYN